MNVRLRRIRSRLRLALLVLRGRSVIFGCRVEGGTLTATYSHLEAGETGFVGVTVR